MPVRHFLRQLPALAALCFFGSVQAETLVFAPLPMEQPEAVVKQFKPLLDHLGKTLGMTIQIDYSTSYAELLRKFRQGKIDLAYLGPLPYVTLKSQYAPAVPVVHFLEKSGKPSYTCAIISNGSQKTLHGLKGQRVALTQPLSTCGYLSTDGLLQRVGSSLEKNKYRYLNKHDEVAQAVARGDFEVGGIKTAIARNYAHLGITVLAETAPLPSFALIANASKVPGKRIDDIRGALENLKPASNAADKELMQGWGENVRYGAVNASDRDYDPVRELRRRADDIPEQGNF